MRVCELKNVVFSTLSLGDKLDLTNNGRPTPVLNLQQEERGCKSRAGYTRRFDINVYNKNPWLCGCDVSHAFFCFVCLIFGGDENWTKVGVRDIKHLVDKTKKHDNSPKHKNNLVSFQLLGNVNIASIKAYAEQINIHNEIVKKNRLIVSKIIDILKLCGTCNLNPLHRHNEKSDSVKKGVFLEIVDYSRNIDLVLDKHLSDSRVFNTTSKTVQNELLQCMFQVCRDHILQEIEKSSFLAVMTDDISDISTQCQIVLVFRYELNGQIFERFWNFFNPEGQDADLLSKCILKQLHLALKNCPNKLIGQTYDGGRHLGGVNVKIKEIYKNAHFVYCYAHQFNDLLEQAVSNISSVRIFFLNLNGIASFFSNSPERTAALCDKRIPRIRWSALRWSTNFQIVQTIITFKDEILECFENIQMGYPKKYNAETTTMAAGFVKWLEDDFFLFWLNIFAVVMPHVKIFCNQLQILLSDAVKIQIAVEHFKKAIENIRTNLPPVEDTSEGTDQRGNINPRTTRRRLNDENLKLSDAREMCDIIIFQIRERFTLIKDNLSAGSKLFLKEKYREYRKSLPLNDIEQFCKAFPLFIDKQILITELNIFYSRSEIIDSSDVSGCLKTLYFILSLGLDIAAFKEITKTLRILVTIPMTTAEPDRCFSKLKLIKTFLRNTTSEDSLSLSALGMLSTESAMVQTIPDFNEKVIEKFIADKERRKEFHYKTMSSSTASTVPKPAEKPATKTSNGRTSRTRSPSLDLPDFVSLNSIASPDDVQDVEVKIDIDETEIKDEIHSDDVDDPMKEEVMDHQEDAPGPSTELRIKFKYDPMKEEVMDHQEDAPGPSTELRIKFKYDPMKEEVMDHQEDAPGPSTELRPDLPIDVPPLVFLSQKSAFAVKPEPTLEEVVEETTPSHHINQTVDDVSRLAAVSRPAVAPIQPSLEARHPIQTFFDSMLQTVDKFPPPLQAKAKQEVLRIVSNLELEYFSQAGSSREQPDP